MFHQAMVKALVVLLLLIAAGSSRAQDKPPAELFFSADDLGETSLSPSGRYLAMTTAQQGLRVGLYLVDLDGKKPPKRLALFRSVDVVDIAWVNEGRLVFSTADNTRGARSEFGPGLFAINPDGTGMRELIKRQQPTEYERDAHDRSLSWDHSLMQVLAPREGHANSEVIVGYQTVNEIVPLWLDVNTGRTRRMLDEMPSGPVEWVFDPQGEPRIVITRKDATRRVHWRGPGQKNWQPLFEGDLMALPFVPQAVDEAGSLYVTHVRGAAGETVLSKYDVEARKPGNPLVSTPGFDFQGHMVFQRGAGEPKGLRLTTDAPTSIWFDPNYKKLQALADARFPDTVNTIICRRCDSPDALMLVQTASDSDPGQVWIYRAQPAPGQSSWQAVAVVRPGIEPSRMATVSFERIRARDGRDLPVWITLPADYKPGQARPTVVYVHGGPWVRGGQWAWQPMQQFLASRGYVVIEPEFRGSAGYGEAHLRAGFKQWGQAMQDDVADALLWARQKGYANDKACVAGASYGGYSTLMGLVKHPELYRCGVAWVAVTDLQLFLKGNWRVNDDIRDISRKHTLPDMVGDVEKDAVMLQANSPVVQAARVKAPLLLAMGQVDERVPLAHGERMRDALVRAGNPPEWIVYAGEAHGWVQPKNRIDFAERVERFLAQHLK